MSKRLSIEDAIYIFDLKEQESEIRRILSSPDAKVRKIRVNTDYADFEIFLSSDSLKTDVSLAYWCTHEPRKCRFGNWVYQYFKELIEIVK